MSATPAPQSAYTVLRRLLGQVELYPRALAAAFAGGLVRVFLPIYVPIYLKRVIDGALLATGRGYEARCDVIVDESSVLLLVLVAHVVASYFRFHYPALAISKIQRNLRVMVYRRVQRQSISFFQQRPTGEIVSRLMTDITNATSFLDTLFIVVVQMALRGGFILTYLFWRDWQAALVICLALPIYALTSNRMKGAIRTAARESSESTAAMTSVLTENIEGIEAIQAFGRELRSKVELQAQAGLHQHCQYRLQILGNALFACTEVISILGQLAVIGFCGWKVLQGQMTVGDVTAFAGYSTMLYGPLQFLVQSVAMVQTATASAERVLAYLEEEPGIRNAPDAEPLRLTAGDVEYQNVTFAYPRETPVVALREVTVVVPGGTRVALVGHSGAGKTSFVNLLPRFYDVEAGAIRIDGQDVRALRLSSLRDAIGIVPQNPFLFSGTLLDNIRFGDPEATDEAVLAAARAAHVDAFVEELETGYETVVGERGVGLSGGQIQRIAIARMFLKSPPILILDEATSALDSVSERYIQDALAELLTGRTSFTIAHRLSTIREADLILVFEQGTLVEQGTHEALLARGGVYADLVAHQLG